MRRIAAGRLVRVIISAGDPKQTLDSGDNFLSLGGSKLTTQPSANYLVIFAISLALLFMQTAKADECMNPPVTKELVLERLCDVTAAYTAFVVSYGEKTGEPRERTVINVEVTELFKGDSHQLNSVLGPGYAGPRLDIGQEVLIFAYEPPATDYLEVRSCSVSGPLSRTNVYLEPIRKAMLDFDKNCSKSARDVRAELLRDQSKENMQRIRERYDRGLSEQRERKNQSPASNTSEP